MNMKRKTKNIIFIIYILSMIVLSAISILLIVKLDNKRRDEAYSNPPGEGWLEEDLEEIFLTTQVNVLEIETHSDGHLIVKVCIYDEDAYRIYRCLYEVKRYQLAYYTWEFVRYV